jgi:hypothetical protein
MTTAGVDDLFSACLIRPRHPSTVIPDSSARLDASWMTGPSITGSEKGMPTSMASAYSPRPTYRSMKSCGVGSPQVR